MRQSILCCAHTAVWRNAWTDGWSGHIALPVCRLWAGLLHDQPQRPGHLGGSVWRLLQHGAVHHRPVHLQRAGQVGAAERHRAPPAPRLRGHGRCWKERLIGVLFIFSKFILYTLLSLSGNSSRLTWVRLQQHQEQFGDFCNTAYLFYTLYYPFREIRAGLPGYGYSSCKSRAYPVLQVHAGSFRISIICRSLTWTTGSFTCVCDHSYACVYTRGVWHTDNESAQHFWLKNSHKFFLCFWRGLKLGFLDRVQCSTNWPPPLRQPKCECWWLVSAQKDPLLLNNLNKRWDNLVIIFVW